MTRSKTISAPRVVKLADVKKTIRAQRVLTNKQVGAVMKKLNKATLKVTWSLRK